MYQNVRLNIIMTNLFSHRVFEVYLAHRKRQNTSKFPSFRTNAMSIVPPSDVPSWTDPIYNAETVFWSGREVQQIKQFLDQDFYLSK